MSSFVHFCRRIGVVPRESRLCRRKYIRQEKNVGTDRNSYTGSHQRQQSKVGRWSWWLEIHHRGEGGEGSPKVGQWQSSEVVAGSWSANGGHWSWPTAVAGVDRQRSLKVIPKVGRKTYQIKLGKKNKRKKEIIVTHGKDVGFLDSCPKQGLGLRCLTHSIPTLETSIPF